MTPSQLNEYKQNGFVILKEVFSKEECDEVVQHMEDLHLGNKHLEGFFQQDKYGARTFNQHLYDPVVLELLIHPRLHVPLSTCFDNEPEGIQSMHFYEGSEHPLHQDQYYLPDCMSAWMAMVDVDENNGALVVQPGSNRGKLVTKDDVPMVMEPNETYEQQQHNRYFPAVEKVFKDNGNELIHVYVDAGDVVLFDGKLIHGGAKVLKPGTRRHALACHYIPYSSDNWERDWQRFSFDGSSRIHYIR